MSVPIPYHLHLSRRYSPICTCGMLTARGRKRKVKCDETRPSCSRCTTTGRKCDGYPQVGGQAAYSWGELLSVREPVAIVKRRVPSSFCHLDDMEIRALDFFRLQAAPVLSKHSSKTFWSCFVSQVGQQEPAVRHALACISCLFEDLDDRSSSILKSSRDRFAITQYNMALSHITSPKADKAIVLMVCLLFICIETMRKNKQMAIQHCSHGINICNETSVGLSGWAKEELRPIFLRLATMPYYFGVEVGDFPEPVGLKMSPRDSEPLEDVSSHTSTAWGSFVNRTVRLVQNGLNYRHGALRHCLVPDSLFEEQRQVIRELATWRQHYKAISKEPQTADFDIEAQIYGQMESIIGYIWAACCLASDLMMYDDHVADFEEIIRLSEQLLELRAQDAKPRPRFIFEMGFMPFLYFVIVSCRRLDLRLAALQHILLVACDRENLFDTKVLYAVGLRMVEIEHGIQLDPSWPEYPDSYAAPMPPDEVRIRIANITDETVTMPDKTGQDFVYQKVCYVVQPNAIVPGFTEWVKVKPCSSNSTTIPRILVASPQTCLDQERG